MIIHSRVVAEGSREGEDGLRWEYKLWTDKDNRRLIKNHYAWFLDTYDSYRENIQRVDAARVCLVANNIEAERLMTEATPPAPGKRRPPRAWPATTTKAL